MGGWIVVLLLGENSDFITTGFFTTGFFSLQLASAVPCEASAMPCRAVPCRLSEICTNAMPPQQQHAASASSAHISMAKGMCGHVCVTLRMQLICGRASQENPWSSVA